MLRLRKNRSTPRDRNALDSDIMWVILKVDLLSNPIILQLVPSIIRVHTASNSLPNPPPVGWNLATAMVQYSL